jgi:hypothetical protein
MGTEDHPSPQRQPSAEDQGAAAGEDELAQRLSELARSLQAYFDPANVLDVTAVVALIPGTDEGSIHVVTGRPYLTSQSPSGELPQRIDALQMEVGSVSGRGVSAAGSAPRSTAET